MLKKIDFTDYPTERKRWVVDKFIQFLDVAKRMNEGKHICETTYYNNQADYVEEQLKIHNLTNFHAVRVSS